MKDKSNKKFWNKFAKLYGPLMEKDRSFYDEICRDIRPYLNTNMEVLELACGSGQLSFKLSKYTKRWFGTDFSEKMILEARKRKRKRGGSRRLIFGLADASRLPFADEKFDGLVIANALHIMPNPDQVMVEIKRVLKADGLLCAPTFLWTEGPAKKIIKALMSLVGFKMYSEWNKKQLVDFVEKHGFSVVEMKLVTGGIAPVGVLIAHL